MKLAGFLSSDEQCQKEFAIGGSLPSIIGVYLR